MNDVIYLAGESISTFLPYYLAYLIAGIPALYTSVRFSGDIIDHRDSKWISTAYVLWPLMLTGVIMENIWSVTKKIFNFGATIFQMASYSLEQALLGVARKAEMAKREKLKNKDFVSLLSYLENSDISETDITDLVIRDIDED
jgi:hypothetical protein